MDEKTCRCYASIGDLIRLWRPMTSEEIERAKGYLPIVSAELRLEAKKAGKDLDAMAEDEDYAVVLKSVICDIVARVLMTSTTAEPMSQMAQSVGPYSFSGTYLVPGGGLFIKKSELQRLGLRGQRAGFIDVYAN